jgi:chromosome segregation ATPase
VARAPGAKQSEFERLERGVGELVRLSGDLRAENDRLRRDLVARDERVQRLERLLREANQRRQDAVKRIDELMTWIDRLDASLSSEDRSPARSREA